LSRCAAGGGTRGMVVATLSAGRNVMTLRSRLRALLRDDSGQDLMEYALLVSLIAMVAYGAVQLTGTSINTFFTNIAATVGSVSTP
jgi:pilus assembly protein Flp/PilA